MKQKIRKSICILLALGLNGCAIAQQHQMRQAYDTAMAEAQLGWVKCKEKKQSGIFKTRYEEMKCMGDIKIAAFNAHGVPITDIILLDNAKALELARLEDEGKLSEDEAHRQYLEYVMQLNNISLQRQMVAHEQAVRERAALTAFGNSLMQQSQPKARCYTNYNNRSSDTTCY